jgi:hypothetical protein
MAICKREPDRTRSARLELIAFVPSGARFEVPLQKIREKMK